MESKQLDNNEKLSKRYNKNCIVTYPFYDSKFDSLLEDIGLNIDKNIVNEYLDDDFILDILYKNEISAVLNGENCDDIDFTILDDVYNDLKQTPFLECINLLNSKKDKLKLPTIIDISGEPDIFRLFFSYDLFFITHMCINELYTTGNIGSNTISALKMGIELFVNK
tara:strand:+ start:6834 stop:7334 length:501 start_codon:yes stop_codon:yes gene_type:complete